MRRAFVFLYAFLVLGFPAFADSVKVGDFEVEEFGTGAYLDVTITSYSGQGGELSMQIPGRPITIIGSEVFAGREITSVEIPTTVTEIRDGAFRGNLLEVLELPGALATIGEEAFSGNDLKQVVLPPYTETVGDRAFAGNRITRITIEADVNLGGNSFDHNFTSWYLAAGRNAGTYIYRLGRWYLESEWLEISAMDDDPIDRSPEAIEPRADIPPTINLGLSGYETVPVMDFEVVGPVSVTRQEIIDFGPLGIRTSRTGSRVTYFDLMMEAASLGADDVVGVHIDTRLDWTRMLFDFVRGYRMTYTYTGTGIAVKYTGTLEQLKSARHRNIEGQDIGYGARVERFRRDMAEPDTPSNETDLYPLLSVGGYTTYNSRSGESSVTGAIGGVETRLSENFFLGLEGGVYPFYYEYGGSKKVHGFSIADIYAGLAFDIGFLSLEGMAGLYFRNEDKNFGPQDRYGFGYIVGGNVGFRSGPHYLFGAFRYAEELNTDDNESLQTFSPGVGYKYTFMPTLADYYAEKYRKAMDRELKGAFTDTPYPLLSVGGYSAYNWTEGTKRGSSGRSGFMSGLELHLSEFFFLGLEGGGFPFSYDKGSGTELDSFFTSDIYAGLAFDIGGLSLEALGGLYYRKEAAGPEGRSGLGYIAGGNAGFRLGPHYLFGAFRYAAELNEFDGEEPVSGISVGAGYKYTYIPRLPDYEEEYQDTLARERDALETADGPVDSGSLYPLLKIGGYGMRSLAKDRDGNYSLGGMATLEAHFAGGSPFAGMEVGAIPLIYDDPHSGIRESTSKLMGLGYVGLPLPTAGDFAFELLLGAYLRDDAYDDGYDDEDPGLGYMLGMNAGFHSGAAYIFGTYRHFKDTSLSTNIIGLGMKYALVSEEDEPVLTELRHRGYRELPDPATEDLTYPVFGAGAWYG
ncbi:MAG: leucine-rich repeat domain-containing protein, partial [Spirochaetales bacterium]|nr:leucine-rich repeat domain-containing protein [Spirochaetales bacterium]